MQATKFPSLGGRDKAANWLEAVQSGENLVQTLSTDTFQAVSTWAGNQEGR